MVRPESLKVPWLASSSVTLDLPISSVQTPPPTTCFDTIRTYTIVLSDTLDRRFYLKRPIEIYVEPEEHGAIFSSDDLNVHVFSTTWREARPEWEGVLLALYLSYRDTPDERLSLAAKVLKDRLHSYVGMD